MKLIELFTLEEQSKYGLKNFVRRNTFEKNPTKVTAEFIKELRSVSADWFKQTNNGTYTVYRGDDDSEAVVVRKLIRTNRMPRDTSIEHHKLANAIFKDMGLMANRSNSIFVIGNQSFASTEFGVQGWVVIPIGKFSYTWSPEVEDLTEDVFREVIDKQNSINLVFYQAAESKLKETFDHNKKNLKAMIKKLKGTIKNPNTKLNKPKASITVRKEEKALQKLEALLSKTTKDFRADNQRLYSSFNSGQGIVYPEKWFDKAEIRQIRKDNKPAGKEEIKKEYFSKYQGDNGSLIKAIRSKNEIMISSPGGGPLSVFLIHDTVWQQIMKPMLRGKKPKISQERLEGILDGYY